MHAYVRKHTYVLCWWLLEFYVLATSKVISRRAWHVQHSHWLLEFMSLHHLRSYQDEHDMCNIPIGFWSFTAVHHLRSSQDEPDMFTIPIGFWSFTSMHHLRSYQDEPDNVQHSHWLLEIYVLASSKVISCRACHVQHAHNWAYIHVGHVLCHVRHVL